jgi:hypothetical protein
MVSWSSLLPAIGVLRVSGASVCGYRAAVLRKRGDGTAGDRALAAAERTARLRGETLDQVLDRNVAELLQELRVSITGVQVLFAFLLGLAFTARFGDLDAADRTVYTVALMASALATLVLIAPVPFHRLLFRRRQKAALVVFGSRFLLAGLALLVLSITASVLLVLTVVLGRAAGVAGAAVVAVVGLVTWYVLPLRHRRDCPTPDEEAGPTGD